MIKKYESLTRTFEARQRQNNNQKLLKTYVSYIRNPKNPDQGQNSGPMGLLLYRMRTSTRI